VNQRHHPFSPSVYTRINNMEAWQSVLVSLIIVCTVLTGSYIAYEQGMFDPLIEKIG
jgi:hypothetical protein